MVGMMGSEHLSSPSGASVPCPHAFWEEGAEAGVWVRICFSFFLIYPKELPIGHLSLPVHLVKTRQQCPSNYDILGVILTINHYSKTTNAIPICLHKEMVLTSLNSLSNMPGEIKRC